MKIQISKRELIVLFMLINLLLIGSIVYIKIKINNLSTYGIGGTVDKISLPYTNKSIRDLNLNSKAFIIYNPVGRIVVAGNDAARVLASADGGLETFVEKMNGKAQDLQLNNTKFFDPAGYSDDNYTT